MYITYQNDRRDATELNQIFNILFNEVVKNHQNNKGVLNKQIYDREQKQT